MARESDLSEWLGSFLGRPRRRRRSGEAVGLSMSSTLPTEKTSSVAVVEGGAVEVAAGWSRVSGEGFFGLRPLLRLLSPIVYLD